MHSKKLGIFIPPKSMLRAFESNITNILSSCCCLPKCVEANSFMNIREGKHLHFNKIWEHPTITKLEYPNLRYAEAIEIFFLSLNFGWYDKWQLCIKVKKILLDLDFAQEQIYSNLKVQLPFKDHYPKSVSFMLNLIGACMLWGVGKTPKDNHHF